MSKFFTHFSLFHFLLFSFIIASGNLKQNELNRLREEHQTLEAEIEDLNAQMAVTIPYSCVKSREDFIKNFSKEELEKLSIELENPRINFECNGWQSKYIKVIETLSNCNLKSDPLEVSQCDVKNLKALKEHLVFAKNGMLNTCQILGYYNERKNLN
jgi:hypothetical protein